MRAEKNHRTDDVIEFPGSHRTTEKPTPAPDALREAPGTAPAPDAAREALGTAPAPDAVPGAPAAAPAPGPVPGAPAATVLNAERGIINTGTVHGGQHVTALACAADADGGARGDV